MEKKKHREWIIGVFTFLVLVSLVGVYLYLKGEKIFTPVSYYYVKFDNVDGLYTGNRVMLNGLAIGKVTAMQYTGRVGESILVELQLSPDFQLNATVRAGIINSGLIGGRVVKLFDAVGAGPYLHPGDTILGRTEGALAESIEESVGPLIGKLDTLVRGLSRLTASLNDVMSEENKAHVNSVMVNVEATSAQLAMASTKLSPMLNRADLAIQNVEAAAKSADSALIGAGRLIDSVQQLNFGSTIASLERASRSADSLLAAMQRGEGTAGRLLKDDQMYIQAQSALASFDSLMTDIKRNPKRYINISVF